MRATGSVVLPARLCSCVTGRQRQQQHAQCGTQRQRAVHGVSPSSGARRHLILHGRRWSRTRARAGLLRRRFCPRVRRPCRARTRCNERGTHAEQRHGWIGRDRRGQRLAAPAPVPRERRGANRRKRHRPANGPPRRSRAARNSAVDESARRAHERVRPAVAVRSRRTTRRRRHAERRRQRRIVHAASSTARHHHAEQLAFRAPSQRRARDRSRRASTPDSRCGATAAHVHGRQFAALSHGHAHPVPRMLG